MRERPSPPWLRLAGVPTGRLVALSALPLALSIGVLFVPAVAIPVVALDLVIAALALADLLAARGQVTVGRTFAAVQAVGRPFDVTLRVANAGRRTLDLRYTDEAPGAATGLPAGAVIAPSTAAEATYALTVDRRGQHAFGDLTVRWTSPLGLWERQRRFETVPPEGVLRVYPDFAQLRETGLRGRLSEERAPVKARRRPGGESEFQRLRPYVPGDPYKHIDWKATARRRDLVTREFGQEQNQNLIFLLDCGRMMSARSGTLTAFDHALNAAVLLGQVALRHGDRVGLLAFDRGVRVWLPPQGGRRTAGRLIRATYDLEPTLEEPDYAAAFRHLQHHVKRRSLVVLLTAVADVVNAELATSLVQALRSRHLALSVWMRDTEVDALVEGPAADDEGRYVRAAASELVAWREKALAGLRQRGALVLDAPASGLTRGLLDGYLEVKARRLL